MTRCTRGAPHQRGLARRSRGTLPDGACGGVVRSSTCTCVGSYGDGTSCTPCGEHAGLVSADVSGAATDCQCSVAYTIDAADASNPRVFADDQSVCTPVVCRADAGAVGEGGGAGGCSCGDGYFGAAAFDRTTNRHAECSPCAAVENAGSDVTCGECQACSRVTSCEDGYHLVAGGDGTPDRCVENVCRCLDSDGVAIGAGAANVACASHGDAVCASCEDGYFFDGSASACLECDGVENAGSAVTCAQCQACSRVTACADEYHVVSGGEGTPDSCDEDVCVCGGGVGTRNSACSVHFGVSLHT
eukprot:SAG11_NODE_10_length_27955_cov_15.365235_7_plen_303_part_00